MTSPQMSQQRTVQPPTFKMNISYKNVAGVEDDEFLDLYLLQLSPPTGGEGHLNQTHWCTIVRGVWFWAWLRRRDTRGKGYSGWGDTQKSYEADGMISYMHLVVVTLQNAGEGDGVQLLSCHGGIRGGKGENQGRDDGIQGRAH